MPPYFKALATISVWVLFIFGCVMVVVTDINWLVNVGFIGAPPAEAFISWGLSVASFTLAVVCMKLRQGMK